MSQNDKQTGSWGPGEWVVREGEGEGDGDGDGVGVGGGFAEAVAGADIFTIFCSISERPQFHPATAYKLQVNTQTEWLFPPTS